jgi:pimeloyl-ACP methyl ester carboxylesterase
VQLVFLHGAGLTAAMWRPQLDALAGAFELAAPDLPGHGEHADERFSFDAAVAAVADGIDPGTPAILVGLSLGGYVAMMLASRQPDLASGLVLTGCSVDYSRSRNRPVATAGEVFQRLWPKRMLRNAQAHAFEARYPDFAETLNAGGLYWQGYADALRAARHVHWRECLAQFDHPVLVLNGALDRPHVRAQQDLVASARHAEAKVIDGAGHLANLDQPDAYTSAVSAFAAHVKGEPHQV